MLLIANHKPQQIRELLDFFHCLQVSVARSEGGVEREGVPGRGSCSSSGPEGQTTWQPLCVKVGSFLCSQLSRSENN